MAATLAAASVFLPTALAAQRPCDPVSAVPSASHDLYCIHLFPAAGSSATGTAELDWIPGPFTVNVAKDGTNRWAVRFSLHDLPPLPAGPAPGYVAWVMPQSLTPMLRLGTVHEGTTALGPFALQSFLVHVSAEPDTTATTRQGRLVLRGESAATRLRPADNYEFFLGGIGVPREQDEHAHHMGAAPDSLGWTGIPMYPGLDMLPSEMALRPPMAAWSLPEQPNAPVARPREVVSLANGDTLDLTAGVVRRTLAGRSYTMFGFNGQYPGPMLRVPQGAQVIVRFHNALPLPSTVHWHGLRLDARFDGVPGLSQPAVEPGESFTYQLVFPDGGIFWYHPHVREDIQQDLGLYGNIFVQPSLPDAWGPVHREEFLILDDLLVGKRRAGAVGPRRADARRHGAVRQPAAGQRRAGLEAAGAAGRGRATLPDQRVEHPDLQPLLRCRGAPQGGGLRPEQLRQGILGGKRRHRPGGAVRGRGAVRGARAGGHGQRGPGAGPHERTVLPGGGHPRRGDSEQRRGPSPTWRRASAPSAPTGSWPTRPQSSSGQTRASRPSGYSSSGPSGWGCRSSRSG